VIECRADFPAARSNDPRSVFPSMATPWPRSDAVDRIDPGVHGREKLDRIKPSEHPTERIVAGNTVRQRDKLEKPPAFAVGEPFDIGPSLGSTERGCQRQENHFHEIVILAAIYSRIGPCRLTPLKRGHAEGDEQVE
jgi:hypothetical protein